MSEGLPNTQPATQAGPSSEVAAVGPEVGGVHSSPLGRRDAACSHAPLRSAEAGNGLQEITTPQCFGSSNARSAAGPRRPPNALRRSDSESRIREIRPSGLMRSEERRVGKECRSLWRLEHTKKKQPAKVAQLVGESLACRIRRYTAE